MNDEQNTTERLLRLLAEHQQELFRNSREADPLRKLSMTLSWATNTVAVGWEEGGRQLSVPLYVVAGKVALGGEDPDQVFVRVFGNRQSLPPGEPVDWTVESRPVPASPISTPFSGRAPTPTASWSKYCGSARPGTPSPVLTNCRS